MLVHITLNSELTGIFKGLKKTHLFRCRKKARLRIAVDIVAAQV